jgi:D-alanine-D-alanine ligase
MSSVNIAVVMGGYSGEFEVSMGSGSIVVEHLRRVTAWNIHPVYITKEGWFAGEDRKAVNREDFSYDDSSGSKVKFKAVFVAVHGTPAEDGKLLAYFDLLGIPHTTSSHFASALTFNKAECNLMLRSAGIRVAPSMFFIGSKLIIGGKSSSNSKEDSAYNNLTDEIDSKLIVDTLGLPLFVKPNCSGSSLGVSKVKTIEDLLPAFESARKESPQVLMESGISGIELACGVHNLHGQAKALAVTEIVPKNEFFDYESKYSGMSEEITPARISPEMTEEIMRTTERVYQLLQLNGLARVDYILNPNGEAYLIEVNTVPGLSSESIIPKQVRYLGEDLGKVFAGLVENLLQV